MFSGGADKLTAFPHVVGNRFFDIDIFSRLDGPKGGQRMPMVWRRYGDDIHIRIFEKLANIGVALDLFAPVLELEQELPDLSAQEAAAADG